MNEQVELFPGDQAPAPKSRDLAFEALCEIWGVEDYRVITRDQRGRVNAALQQLREVHPELDAHELSLVIRARAKNWSSLYPEIKLTPQALTTHWASLEEAPRPTPIPQTNASVLRDCRTCGGERFLLVRLRAPVQTAWMRSKDIEPNLKVPGQEEYRRCPTCNA
jgi:hypothetical protein